MGAWGSGNFENDDAMDWVADLEETRNLKLVKQTLREVLDAGDGYLEAPIGARGRFVRRAGRQMDRDDARALNAFLFFVLNFTAE